MGLPRLQTACWCLDLKTGNIVLGCLNAFLSFIMFVIMIVVSVTVSAQENGEILRGQIDVEDEAALTGLRAMSIILVLMFLAKLLFDLLFVYGVISERAAIIKAYFIMWLVFFLLSMFTFFINAPFYTASTIIAEVTYILFNIYAVLLCNSFYKQLNEREEV
ncbi:hypothetical protein NE865_04703 [Phthorimaea operculella]|nr:hypothetical protein NE865_04703 [Phthorimaea operculella]